MQFTTLTALAALAISQVSAGYLSHRHFHRRSAYVNPEVIEKRNVLATESASKLSSLGVLSGSNPAESNGAAWLGTGGAYTGDFVNNSTESIILVLWSAAAGYKSSFVKVTQPLITSTIPPGGVQTVSFANGVSGAFTAIYPDTALTPYGQISQTWGEFTFSGDDTTVDVSREVAMDGRGLRIQTPTCVSDMTTCVFVCTDGSNSCMTAYTLENCAANSQVGATSGTSLGAASGGCQGFTSGKSVTAYFF